MNEKAPATIKQWLLGAAMITLFVCLCGSLIGLAKGFQGEDGSLGKALDIGLRTTVMFLVLVNLALAIVALLAYCRVPQHWRTLVLIPLAMAGLHGIQTIIDREPANFWKESMSGFWLGILITIGIVWAKRKGWIPANVVKRTK